ncbi:hypothetical protein BH10PSE12_BH10PSE12_29890 [soil metagenome]
MSIFKSNTTTRAFELADMPAIMCGYFKIALLLSDRYFQNLLKLSPKIRRQYMTSYLARTLTIRSRLQAVISHYIFLRGHLKPSSFGSILHSGLCLWTRKFEAHDFSIVLKLNALHLYEGEMLLVMYRENIALNQISFSIVAGHLVGQSEPYVLLIGSAQGAVPEIGDHAFVVKANGGVAPAHLLIAAARGAAEALGVDALAGVANAAQISKTHPSGAQFTFDYDQFWPMFGGAQNAKGFFVLPIAADEHISKDKSSAHRRRSRKKAIFKAETANQVARSLRLHVEQAQACTDARPLKFGLKAKGKALTD